MIRLPLTIPVSRDLQQSYLARGLVSDATLEQVLEVTALRGPDMMALFDLTDSGKRYSFADISDTVTRLVSYWRRVGVRPGDVIMLQAPNSAELYIGCWAAFQAGCVCVPVVDIYRAHEVSRLLDAVRPDVIVTAADHAGFKLPAMFDDLLAERNIRPKARLVIGGEHPNWIPFEAGLLDSGEYGAPGYRDPDEPALVLFTSGTTSTPKAVVHSSRTLLADVHQVAWARAFTWRDRRYLAVPLAHITGVVLGMLLPGATGGSLVLSRPSSMTQTVEELLEYRVTEASGPPHMLSLILDRIQGTRPSLRRWGSVPWGGGRREDDPIFRAEELDIRLACGYGSTEFPTVTACVPGTSLAERMETDGRLAPGVECQAVDPDTREPLPTGHEGELRVRGPERLVCYLDPDQTSTDIDAGGWYYTGDLGTVDARTAVRISGRLKDTISRGGEKFSAGDIEAALRRHPGVAAVAVVAAPDRRYGEVPAAFIVPAEGAAVPTSEDLSAFLLELGVAKQKTPARWQTLAALPLGPTGKVHKAELRKTLTIDDVD